MSAKNATPRQRSSTTTDANPAKPKSGRLYVVKKYVYAKNAQQALRFEKRQHADDIWIDEAWKSMNMPSFENKPMGFHP